VKPGNEPTARTRWREGRSREGRQWKETRPARRGRTTCFTKIQRLAEKAKLEPKLQFTSLAHLIDGDLLTEAYRLLRKDASPGIDGLTAEEYERDLEGNLRALHARLRDGTYRAQPVRRVYIEKESGKLRPLGIPALEDKVAQKAALMVLEAIYEQDFLPCSFGFRPGRNAHAALDALWAAIVFGRTSYVLDADIKGYFDNIVREHLMEFIRRRVKDGALLRLIAKWLHVGVVEDGRLLPTTKGTPQGAVISPWMANVYLHYVLDEWVEQEVKPRLRGEIRLVRYADDFVVCLEYRDDAERFATVLRKRFARYGLELNEEKTRLIAFGRDAFFSARGKGTGKPATFDFLGFTHICALSRARKFTVHLRTARKRKRRTMRRIMEWCKENRHRSIREQQRALNRQLQGHYAYYGRRSNFASLMQVHRYVRKTWKRWLSRRGQRGRISWDAFNRILERYPLHLPYITRPRPSATSG
jgi:RNA-directed DNA polymerase